ncbi:MAG TPA: hypothetical protein VK797_17615 [Tepidisphaeraceae bacterium]|jgi:hypothetical protein|nr:hypothetical protein [Tepidisphaeraceae bacterium]
MKPTIALVAVFVWTISAVALADGPTAKVYHCKKIDVQIELPARWSVEDPLPQSNDVTYAVQLLSPEEEGEGALRDNVTILATIPVDKSLTLEGAVKVMFPPAAQPGVTNYKFLGARKVRFAGIEAYRGIATGTIVDNEARFTTWLIVKDGRVYNIGVVTKKDTDPLSRPSIATIISSFKIG